MFLVSGVDLVSAVCAAGVVGAFPTVNCRTSDELENWLTEIETRLAKIVEQNGDPVAPWCSNLIVHHSNARLKDDLAVLLRHKPEIVITSVGSPAPVVEPLHDPAEINAIISADPRIPTNNREIVLRLIDGSDLHEFKPDYGDTLITGFARIKGFEVGILCNNGVLFSESAMKATQFIELCCQRDIPLLFMADINGFMVGREAEEAGIAKHGAKMITAMTCANVAKYTLIIGGSYGAGYLAMCGRPFKPNAATTLAMVKDDQHKRDGTSWTDAQREAYKAPVRKTFEDFANAYNFARNTWCDMVIEPAETRDVMALLLDLAGRVPALPSRFGVFRM